MTADEHQDGYNWALLGKVVRERRLELGISVSAAAEAAGMNRATWTSVESATRRLTQARWAHVEQTLAWSAGSVGRIFNGGEPVVAIQAEPVSARVDVQVLADVLCVSLSAAALDLLLAELLKRRAVR